MSRHGWLIETEKRQSSILRIIGIQCTNGKYSDDFVSNYVDINIKPRMQRIFGVGSVTSLGNTYALRVWMKPDVLAQYGLTPLNAFILEKKPPYMAPEVIMQIDAIPLNQNHKVDKRALPKPVRSVTTESQQTENAPMNVLEKELHDIISKLVGNSDFGVTTLLGHTGLTSITAMKLAVEINKRYGIELDAKSMAKSVTLQSIENEILRSLMDEGRSKTGDETPQPSDISHPKSAPLSYAQLGVYYECMKHPLDTTYNLPTAIILPPGIEGDKVEQALLQLISEKCRPT